MWWNGRKLFETSAIFEEIPIKVHNSHLVHGFLYELREQKAMRYISPQHTTNACKFCV
jgi:hypothetical protein